MESSLLVFKTSDCLLHQDFTYFISQLSKIGVLVMANKGEHDMDGDMWSLFGDLSYISCYIILLIVTDNGKHDVHGDMRSLFRHNIMFYLYKLLLIVADDDEHDACVVTRGPSILFGIYLIMDMGVVNIMFLIVAGDEHEIKY